MDINALHRCARWMWGDRLPTDSRGCTVDLTHHETHCVLWIACQDKLVKMFRNEQRMMDLDEDLTAWFASNAHEFPWQDPLTNLRHLSDQIRDREMN